jgi:uncharacterized protein YdaU (DUF1376 family)
VNYYPFHIGDYVSATRHLSWEEDAAYRRLLDTYYITEKPLPADLRSVCRLVLATTESQREAVRVVLAEFFKATPDGWINTRADEEITAMREKQNKQREKANKRWHKPEAEPGNATASTTDAAASKADAVGMPPTPTPTPTPTPKEEKGEVVVGGVGEGGKKPPQDPGVDDAGITGDAPAPTPPAPPRVDPEPPKAVAAARPADVDAQTWGDFLALRRAKKAPVTETVLKRASAEAQKAGMPLAQFLAVWCARGSQGLEAAWLTPEERRPGPAAPAETFRERDERNARQRWEEMTGRVHPDNLKPAGLVIDITPAAAPLIPIGAAK